MSRMVLCAAVLVPALSIGVRTQTLQVEPVGGVQSPPPTGARFDVVSIKPNTTPMTGGTSFSPVRTLPDGTSINTNVTIQVLVPIPPGARQIVGLPDWTRTERYDITMKPPAGSTPADRPEMMRNMFIERMKFAGHIEEREQSTYALVVVRTDGRLGPELKPSTLDCQQRPQASGAAPGAPVTIPSAAADMNRCGLAVRAVAGMQTIASGGVAMDELARSIAGAAGALVNNRTGLQGLYALTLTFMPSRGPVVEVRSDAAPEIFTALQEQLGLRLQSEKTMVPVFVVDRLERPTEN